MSSATAPVVVLTLLASLTHPPLVVRTTLLVLVPLLKPLPKETGWPALVLLMLALVPTGRPLLLRSVPGKTPTTRLLKR